MKIYLVLLMAILDALQMSFTTPDTSEHFAYALTVIASIQSAFEEDLINIDDINIELLRH